jgi:hypothetical protein
VHPGKPVVNMNYSIHTFTQKPELRDPIDRLSEESWPPFLLHGNIHHWRLLFEMFPDYQVLLCDSTEKLMAVGHTVPLIWDGSLSDLPLTIEEIILRAERVNRSQQTPNTLSALAAMVGSIYQGQNLSGRLVEEMRSLAGRHSCTALIAPVRPTWKNRYPLTPMERYVEWKRTDGAPLDPWIRVHWRLGALPLCVAPNTLTVEGTIKEWEEWTQMAFPESGIYVIPGGLQPLMIDRDQNKGRYEDPNYWMKHSIVV